MPATPASWNAVVVASWNVAILTPQGIASRLFGLAKGTPVEVRVTMDGRSPFQVHHDGLTVVAGDSQLLVEPDRQDYAGLARAMQLASKAIASLPETPFVAAGFNVRFKLDSIPEDLANRLRCSLDNSLSDAGFQISSRRFARSVIEGEGRINFEISMEGDTGLVVLNFHRTSSVPADLTAWMATPESEIKDRVERLLGSTGGLEQRGGT
jgi:hypothetical protein